MDRLRSRPNSHVRHVGTYHRKRAHVGGRISFAPMVAAACVVHYWHRRHGRHRASAAKLVSVFGSLDLAALDCRYRTCFANAECGTGPEKRNSPPGVPRTKYSTLGDFTFSDRALG